MADENIIISDLETGKAGEYIVCADLILSGYRAFLADQGSAFDVVMDSGDGLLKVQVKTTRGKLVVSGGGRVNNKSRYIFNAMQKGRHGKKRYKEGDVDILALVALDKRKIAYVPFQEVKTCMVFREESDTDWKRPPSEEIVNRNALINKRIKDGGEINEVAREFGVRWWTVRDVVNPPAKKSRISVERNKVGFFFSDYDLKRAVERVLINAGRQ